MSLLRNLVELVALRVKDVTPIPKCEIQNFIEEQGLSVREDHLLFLMRFGYAPGGRPEIFKWYGGDFDFETFKDVYLEKWPEMELPPGNTFFGTSFVGDSFCIDEKSGGIFAYDQGQRYGMVHETIDGFLLRCIISTYDQEIFSNIIINQNISSEQLEEFRKENVKYKVLGGTSFELNYKNVDDPLVVSEYYLLEGNLVAIYPSTRTLLTLSGGGLENLSS